MFSQASVILSTGGGVSASGSRGWGCLPLGPEGGGCLDTQPLADTPPPPKTDTLRNLMKIFLSVLRAEISEEHGLNLEYAHQLDLNFISQSCVSLIFMYFIVAILILLSWLRTLHFNIRSSASAELSQQECFQLLSRATQVFREEYIQKQDLALQEIEKR